MKKIILCVCVCVRATSAVVGSSSSKKRRKRRKKIKSKDFICAACSMLIRADKPKGLCGRGNSASQPVCVCVCELYAPLYYIITSNNDYSHTHTRITWCSLEMALIFLQPHEWKLHSTHSTVAAPLLLPCCLPPAPSLVENAKRAPQINKFASHDTTQNNKRQWQIFFNVHFIIIMSS